jgi:Na+-driven multidrug efflux pump
MIDAKNKESLEQNSCSKLFRGSVQADCDMKRGLDKEFLTIAIPAFIQFAAEPLASLINTVYLGRLGSLALGAAGVAISAQYSVSKLYNDPLLRTSISLVAAASPLPDNSTLSDSPDQMNTSCNSQLSKAVSSALLLAGVIGIIQGAVYVLWSGSIINSMGVASSSPMYEPAAAYLRVRGIGAPGATLWLVANGIFRGLGDTATPLRWALAFAALNAMLDPLFIFGLRLGCPGAAIGTVLAQYAALAPLLLQVRTRPHVRCLCARTAPKEHAVLHRET